MKTIKDILLDGFWIMPSTPSFVEDGEIPYITSKNIKVGEIDFSNVQYISSEDFKTISKNRPIKINDMLISMIGTLGNIAIVKETDGEFYGQNMYLLRLNPEVINLDYFFHYIIFLLLVYLIAYIYQKAHHQVLGMLCFLFLILILHIQEL